MKPLKGSIPWELLRMLEETPGVSGVSLQRTARGHAKLRFSVGSVQRLYVCPCTTGDGRRALQNSKAGLRRVIGAARAAG